MKLNSFKKKEHKMSQCTQVVDARDLVAGVQVKTAEETMVPQEKLCQQEVRDCVQCRNKFEDNMHKGLGLILGQCATRLVNTLQNRKDWKTIEAKGDPIKLSSAIKEITQNFQDSKCPIATVHKAITNFFLIKQGEKEGLLAYAKRFKCAHDMLEEHSGKMALTELSVSKGWKTKNNDTKKEEHCETACNRLVAYSFIIGADAKTAGQLSHGLANHGAFGDHKCPQDLLVVSATETVQNYNGKAAANTNGGGNSNRGQHQTNNVATNRNSPETQTGFFQTNNNGNNNQQNRGSGNDRPNHQQNNDVITCCVCNQPGHIARNCPLIQKGNNNSQQNDDRQVHFQQGEEGSKRNQEKNTENGEGNVFNATQLFQSQCNYANNFHLQNERPHLRNKLLIDNQSTTGIF